MGREALLALAGSRIRTRQELMLLAVRCISGSGQHLSQCSQAGNSRACGFVMLEDGVHLGGDGPVVALDT